jgi:hypothetical protein
MIQYDRMEIKIVTAIAAVEVAFWVLLAAGLAARYVFNRRRLSTVLLASVPLADVVLLAVTAAHLAGGAQAEPTHGLAALYLGFSVVFGPSIVAAADRRAGRHSTPAPQVSHWQWWLRAVKASALAAAVLAVLVALADDPEPLLLYFAQLGAITSLWLLFGPLWTEATKARGRAAPGCSR